MPPPDATLNDLLRHLPFPLVLFETGSPTGFANDRFAEVFHSGQLDGPELLRLLRQSGDGWHTVALRRRDEADQTTRAQAIDVPYGVLVVIDDTPGLPSDQEYARLQRRIAELETLSATDRLTGAWNRVHLEQSVAMEMNRAARLNQFVTMILLDIDDFKRINDVHGHLVGDAVLKEFVARVRVRMRATDSLFRWGGDEFIVLAIGIGYRGGTVLAENLREAIAAEPFATVGSISASVGVAEYVDIESAESWFRRTDQALYAAKTRGGNRVYVERRGTSDLAADSLGFGVLSLTWQEAYECGEPTIDGEHRELFDLGNALIAAALIADSKPDVWRTALDTLLAHVVRHFDNEEAVLARHGYQRLASHQGAHAALVQRARQLKAVVNDHGPSLGPLVNFVARDVIAKHILNVDRDYYPLFRR